MPPAGQHRVDPGPVLVDQVQRGRLGGESRAADRDVALARLGSQPLDLLRHAAGGQAGMALHRRQRGGEHHLRERLPERGPLEHGVVERWILVGGLPVQHRLVQPSSQQVDADLPDLVGDEAEDLLVGRRPVEAAVRPGDVAVK
jgi:pimeloyl-ACP methyl ester carboxylesterase